ncbi:MAG: hypothetical protein WCA00_19945 [Candidatus Acidiferrales bacterium]
MDLRKQSIVLVCLVSAAASALSTSAATNCTASQQAAVECFVANAVATNLTKPRYGMTLARFESYGIAVSQILQTRHTYLVLVGVSSAVADAMPPSNSDGSPNLFAQHHAIGDIVSAASAAGLVSIPSKTTLQDMEWFARDVSTAMNDNSGFLQLLTPGISLRMIDSYVVTATAGSQVNWTEVETNLTNAVNSFVKAGLIKVPAGITAAQVTTFANSIAHIIYTYKAETGRTSLG